MPTVLTLPSPIVTPAAWPLVLGTSGPNLSYYEDFVAEAANAVALGTVGAASGNAITYNDGNSTFNHPGDVIIGSGTGGAGTGGSMIVTVNASGGSALCLNGMNTAGQVWSWGTCVLPSALPGTTASSYQAGMTHTSTNSPWTNGTGFYLSSNNATVNDWYVVVNGAAAVDTGVAASAGVWTRLGMYCDGTTVHFYINGVEAVPAATAVTNLPSTSQCIGCWTSVAGSATAVSLAVDYIAYQPVLTR